MKQSKPTPNLHKSLFAVILKVFILLTFKGMAEREGFEPSKGYKPLLVFKTSAFNRSATSPEILYYLLSIC
jgi:hypothetical protein